MSLTNRIGGKWILPSLVLVLIAGMVVWVLHNVPIADIGIALHNLRWWQILVIVMVNITLYLLVTFRWWITLHTTVPRLRFLPLMGVRISAFSLSYFTLGPQAGGEFLQVYTLQKKFAVSYSRATASVLLDKLLEFLVNILLLAFGLAALLYSGLLLQNRSAFLIGGLLLILLILAPFIYLHLLYKHRYPLTFILRHLPFLHQRSKPLRFVRAAEWMAGNFCQHHPRLLLGALGASVLAAAGMLADYALMIHFLGIDLSFWKMAAGWTSGWLAFLFPVPGGLGAFETSQVFSLGLLGIPAAIALSLALVMRARDLFIGGIGLFLVVIGVSAWNRKPYDRLGNLMEKITVNASRKGKLS